MPKSIQIRGIAWNHTRGYLPLVAAAQRFEDLFEDVEIKWDRRSLKSFGDASLEELAQQFDLLVIDHPYVGHFASHRIVEPLNRHLSADFLKDLQSHSVGRSFESYWFAEQLWAVPIDAAAPVSSVREDLFGNAGLRRPESWEDVCDLARRGLVVVPATPVDSLMNFFMLCCGLGQEPFAQGDGCVSREVGLRALELLRELIRLCPPECLVRNPIETYRQMACTNEYLYCPFAFGYSNYSRTGYSPAELTFGELVSLEGRPMRSTLGGAGLAVSVGSQNLPWSLTFLQFVASATCQGTLYFSSGGQPAHRSAWVDPKVNSECRNFFRNTLSVLDRAYLRPRHDGYLAFQDRGSLLIHAFLRSGGEPAEVVRSLNEISSASRGASNQES